MGLNHKVIFGMKLRQHREAAGLSLTQFAGRTGLSTPYLTEIEHGKKYPPSKVQDQGLSQAPGKDCSAPEQYSKYEHIQHDGNKGDRVRWRRKVVVSGGIWK